MNALGASERIRRRYGAPAAAASEPAQSGVTLALTLAWMVYCRPEIARVFPALVACFGNMALPGKRSVRIKESRRLAAAAVENMRTAKRAAGHDDNRTRLLARPWRRPDPRVVGRVLRAVWRNAGIALHRARTYEQTAFVSFPGYRAVLYEAMARFPNVSVAGWIHITRTTIPFSLDTIAERDFYEVVCLIGEWTQIFDDMRRHDWPVTVPLAGTTEGLDNYMRLYFAVSVTEGHQITHVTPEACAKILRDAEAANVEAEAQVKAQEALDRAEKDGASCPS